MNKPTSLAEERLARQRNDRISILSNLDCLYGVPVEELEQLVDLCYFRTFLTGETITSERHENEFFYIILQGSVSLKLHDKDGQEVLLEILSRGDCCGEELLFSEFSLNIGAYAETNCCALQCSVVDVRSLFNKHPVLQDTLYRTYLRRLVECKLARVPLFKQIPILDRLDLAAQLQPVQYPRNTLISHQGEEGKALFIIDSGQVTVSIDGKIVAILSAGDFFGEIALIYQQSHSATIQTITPVNLLTLSEERFHTLLASHPDLEKQLRIVCEQRLDANKLQKDDTIRSNILYLALEQGVIRGTHALVRHLERCDPNCRDCEIACTNRHGLALLRINGLVIGKYDIVHTCRQCRFGAECVEVCPVDAIQWNEQRSLVITDACTGCGDCIPACPYHAVSLVCDKPNHFAILVQALRKKMRRFSRHSETIISCQTIHKLPCAIKCDLCYGYDNLACVHACTKNALTLTPVEEIVSLKIGR